MKKITLLIVSIWMFSGCGEIDNKEVSKENFTKILNEYYGRNCIRIGTGDFPKEEPVKDSGWGSSIKELEALEKIGLLSSTEIKIEQPAAFSKKVLVDGKKFILTEQGNKLYKKEKYSKGFCIANHTIATIDNYTTPANMIGMTMTRVNYTFNTIESTELLKNIMKEEVLAKRLSTQIDKKSNRAELILTEMKGWMHQRDFKRLR